MKVLLVSEDLPAKLVGGLGKHVVTLGNALIAGGHSVTLMGHNAVSYEECVGEIGFNGTFIAGFVHPIGGWKEQQFGFFNPLKRPYFARRLANSILEHAHDFDVVHYHGHLPMLGNYIPTSINFVQTRHDQGSDCVTHVRFKNGDVCRERSPVACATCIHPKPGFIRTQLSAVAVERYRKDVALAFSRHPVVFVSDFLRQNFLETLPDADLSKGLVIHNFVDESLLSQTAFIARAKVDSQKVRVHIAGRIDEAKGIPALLDLLLPMMPPAWHVDVFGDGPLRPMAEAKFAGKAVTFHGHQLYRETINATRTSTVVVIPSVWEEPCGTVILEALRLGKVCYALARGGTPELERYGSPGQLRLFNDLSSLVAGLVSASAFKDQFGGLSAGVDAVVPMLLDVYARGVKKVSA